MDISVVTAGIAALAAIAGIFVTQFVAERYRRFLDGSAIAAGLAGELASYEQSLPLLRPFLEGLIQQSRAGRTDFTFRPQPKATDIFFDQTVPKLGLLGPALVEDVVYVYTNIKGFRLAYEVITTQHKDMQPTEFIGRCMQAVDIMDRAQDRGKSLVLALSARAGAPFIPLSKESRAARRLYNEGRPGTA